MSWPYYVVDAFTSQRYAGNPAAVVLDAEGLDDAQMQAIAAEFNLSETTFVLPPETMEREIAGGSNSENVVTIARAKAGGSALVRFRWFTPSCEVDMCGHATIAGLHTLVESGRVAHAGHEAHAESETSTIVRIETKSGLLTGFIESIPGAHEGRMIWLELIKPRLTDHAIPATALAEVLGLGTDSFETSLPPARTQDLDLLVFVKDFMVLNDARPDFGGLAELLNGQGLRGLGLATVHTLTPSVHVQSRFFAPNVGINEDPVTGSIHGPLAAYLVAHGLVPTRDGMAGLSCVQAKAGGRAGLVHALVRTEENGSYNVRIGGQAITTMHGTLV